MFNLLLLIVLTIKLFTLQSSLHHDIGQADGRLVCPGSVANIYLAMLQQLQKAHPGLQGDLSQVHIAIRDAGVSQPGLLPEGGAQHDVSKAELGTFGIF